MKTCSIDKCNKKHYAKGHCCNHYKYYRDTPERRNLGDICKEDKCNKKVSTKNKYCQAHRKVCVECTTRICSTALYCQFHNLTGKNNPNWNGGIAQYYNHSLLKKQRIIVLEMSNYKCYHCKGEATETHHLDGSKNNHSLINLIAVCRKCHFNVYHRGPRTTSKFKKIYGYTLQEIADKLNCSPSTISKWHLSQGYKFVSLRLNRKDKNEKQLQMC